MTHDAWLTKLVNTHLAGAGNALLAFLGQTASNPREPWADAVVMELFVAVVLVALMYFLRARLSVDKPGITQHVF